MPQIKLIFFFIFFSGTSLINAMSVRPTNFVIIFIDDMGYGDIEPFGSKTFKTPHLNQMAKEGLKLTEFYVSWTACSPSRASLLTGCYAQRVGFDGRVVFPGDERGLNPKETTIASMLKGKGYKTGCFGKWHLGDQPDFYPSHYGFDEYYGIPYSNDMWPPNQRQNYPPLPIMHNGQVVQEVSGDEEQAVLCQQFTEAAVQFIKKHKDDRFFIYLPHAFVHNPRLARKEFMDRANGDATRAHVEEVDWSTGEILKTLKELKIDKNTLVIFTSDNGPAGGGLSAGPLRGNKGGPVYEGHMRVPTIAWWPDHIPANSVCHEIGETIDLLPTIGRLALAKVPPNDIIDGLDISSFFWNPSEAKSPRKVRYYKNIGIREGKWKLLKAKKWELYDLDKDLGETKNIIDQHPDVAKRLQGMLDQHNEYLESTARPAAFVENPKVIVPRPGLTGVEAWKSVLTKKKKR